MKFNEKMTLWNKIQKRVKLNKGKGNIVLAKKLYNFLVAKAGTVVKNIKVSDTFLEDYKEFWKSHKKAQIRTNRDKIREANYLKLSIAKKIIEENSQEIIEEKFGKFSDWFFSHRDAYIGNINNHGRLANYITLVKLN